MKRILFIMFFALLVYGCTQQQQENSNFLGKSYPEHMPDGYEMTCDGHGQYIGVYRKLDISIGRYGDFKPYHSEEGARKRCWDQYWYEHDGKDHSIPQYTDFKSCD